VFLQSSALAGHSLKDFPPPQSQIIDHRIPTRKDQKIQPSFVRIKALSEKLTVSLASKFRSPDIGIHTNVRFSVRFHSFQPHLLQAGIADSFGSPSQGQIHWAIRSVAYRSRPCRIWNPKMPEKKSGQFWVPAPSIGNPIKMRSSKLYVRSSEIGRVSICFLAPLFRVSLKTVIV
jgi:hypothetical protein